MWLLLSTSTFGATFRVPTDAPTVAAAVNAASSGDTIHLEPGRHVGSVLIVGTTLTFEGSPGSVWVADDDEALDCESFASCTVVGVTFDGDGRFRGIEANTDSDLRVEQSTFFGGSDVDGGGIRSSGAASLVVLDSVFRDNAVSEWGGHIQVASTETVEIRRSSFVRGQALQGGAIHLSGAGSTRLSDLWLVDNSALDDGGGVMAEDTVDFWMSRSFVCGNTAVDTGGGLGIRGAQSLLIGNLFGRNVAGRIGGALRTTDGSLETRNNHFVADSAPDAGAAVHSTSYQWSVNDFVGFGDGSVAHHDYLATLSHTLFYGNVDGDTDATVTSSVLFDDPLLVQSPPTGCDPAWFAPTAGSPLVDAGDPEVSDVDGGLSDIGAFGGPDPYDLDAPPPFDGDSDGVSSDFDCNDADPSIAPGLPEVVGDGVDQDCDGGEICFPDADGDGRGEPGGIVSVDVDCADAGEAPRADDVCPGHDDSLDIDGDSIPDGCDDLGGDRDGDGVPDAIDPAPDDDGGDGIALRRDPSPRCSHGSPAPWGLWAWIGWIVVRRRGIRPETGSIRAR